MPLACGEKFGSGGGGASNPFLLNCLLFLWDDEGFVFRTLPKVVFNNVEDHFPRLALASASASPLTAAMHERLSTTNAAAATAVTYKKENTTEYILVVSL